ncbi:MAG TPA: hypothetical protein DCL73_13955 [Treponema sp.]|nr:hypothetical protein [Treponema sp.]
MKKLVLYEDIVCGTTDDTGSGILRICSASVTKRDMSPEPEEYLSNCEQCAPGGQLSVPAGTYFFIQGFLQPGRRIFAADGTPDEAVYKAAEELWLEYVWQETEPADNTVYVRILTHEGDYADKTTGQKKSAGLVFQLFRRNK